MMKYKAAFELFQKVHANLCKPIDDIKNYSTLICPFESGKCGKRKNYLENEKSFLDDIKSRFHSF